MANLLRRGCMTALLMGAGLVWTLSGDLEAREVDLDHKVVPQSEITDSPLRLVGTAVTGDPRQRLAVIEAVQSRQQWSLHEGDHAGNILIKEIRRDHIVVDAGKGDRTIKIRSFLVRYTKTPPSPTAGSSITPANRIGSRQRRMVMDRAAIENALADPETVLDRVQIRSARLFNREVGFRISAFDPDSIFAKMGLRNGDLLLAINDHEIVGPQEAISILESLRDGGDIDLTLRRRARTYHINLQIQ